MGRVTLEEAAAVMDDYFSALVAIGRRARIETNERFLVNAKHSRSALAVIDLAVRVFGAKVSTSSVRLLLFSLEEHAFLPLKEQKSMIVLIHKICGRNFSQT